MEARRSSRQLNLVIMATHNLKNLKWQDVDVINILQCLEITVSMLLYVWVYA